MKFGVFLPTFLLDRRPGRGAEIRAFARRAEELGFDSLWATDHVVTARQFYRVGWLDAVVSLAHVAAVTEAVQLGTSILILPLRQPALLAKEIATLVDLSGGRYVFGVGTGWYEPEFAACGVAKADRGARTDEVLAATLALLRGPEVDFHGRYYRLDGVTVEPHAAPLPPVWVAGGSQLAHAASPEAPTLDPRVLRRIAAADGWIARPTSPPESIAADRRLIEEARGGRPLVVAHENFVWMATGTAEEVEAEQQRRFGAVISDRRPWEYLDAVYLPGTIDVIQRKVQARIDAGVDYLLLHTLTADLEQLELVARHIVAPFRDTGRMEKGTLGELRAVGTR